MKVSIIITAYNSEKYISRAVRSCLEQSFHKKEYEIIVVDDGSTDNTGEILKSFGEWIKVIHVGENKGLPNASNLGIRKALSRFVVRVDADDYIHEDLIKIEYLYLALNNEVDAVSCDYLLVDEKENIIVRKDASTEPIACGIMFRKDLLIDIGLYDEKFKLMEDEELRIRFESKYKIDNLKYPLYRYRKHENNSTNNKDLMEHYRNLLNQKHSRE